MKEELFNYTLKKYLTSEYCDTNFVKPIKVEIETDFWEVVQQFPDYERHTSYTPWGNFTLKGSHTNEEKYVEHYGNPLAQLYFERMIVCVTKENDKISFKVFKYYKTRRLGGKWSKVRTNCYFITYNYRTNSLYTGLLENYHLKRKCRKRLIRILFDKDPINMMRGYLRSSFIPMIDSISILDTPTIINQVISTFVNAIPGTEKYADLLPEQRFYKRYLDAQGTKIPNNWYELMMASPQPKKKDLVKSGYKYIDALMAVHNLKGDKVKRVLHTVKSFDKPITFKNACDIFGEKFILNQPDDFVRTLLEKGKQIFNVDVCKGLPKSEMVNFFEVYKIFHKGLINYDVINDHFRFYGLLKQMEPIKWSSRTHDEFVQEHYDWSEKYSHYTDGDFTRIYNQEFVDRVNDVILTKDGPYYPEVLVTSKRYNNESLFQSNCVKTYIKRVGSLLISLRRGEGETEERASIEYQIIPLVWPDRLEFKLNRVQTLGKYNRSLDNSWDDSLIKLDGRISIYEGLFNTIQIQGEFNNKKIVSDYKIKEYDRTGYDKGVVDIKKGVYLDWENDSIMKLNSYNYNWVVDLENDDDLFGF